MLDFEYEAPPTLDEAIALMVQNNGRVRPIAGGTDLIDQIRIAQNEQIGGASEKPALFECFDLHR